MAPIVIRGEYGRHLLVMFVLYALLTLSLDLIIGRTGDYTLGHGAFFGIGAYTTGLLTVKLGVPIEGGVIAACIMSGLVGSLIGFTCLRLRGLYLLLVTLGFAMVIYGVVINWYELTGGDYGLAGIPTPVIGLPFLPRIEIMGAFRYYYFLLPFAAAVIYLISRLFNSKPGRAMVAIRENLELAASVGVNVFKYRMLAFCLGAMLAGLTGALYAHYVNFVTPETFKIYYMFMMIVMLVVGGRGTLWGPVLGAALFIFLPEYLRIVEEVRLILFGVILMLCAILVPAGVYPVLLSLWHRLIGWGRLKRIA